MNLIGKKALLDNINNIEKVELSNKNSDIISLLKSKKIKYFIKEDKYFNTNFKNVNHQYIISYTKNIPDNISIETIINSGNKKINIVILDEIQDPYNFGNIIRTCESFGVDCIVYKNVNQVQINDFVIKSSMGAINNIKLFKVANLSNVIEKLKDNGFWIYATTLNDKSENFKKIKFDDKSVFIFGNENKGINAGLIKLSDFCIKIPMRGKTQSLNVSTSVGVILSHIDFL
jgi:23S rRNA (guanosine2251-2'-O)-methyltransferase